MEAGDALRKLVGGLLMAAGALVATSCGLCTGYFTVISLAELFGKDGPSTLGFVSPFLLAGVVATAVGVGLSLLGLRMLRGGPAPPSPDQQRGERDGDELGRTGGAVEPERPPDV